MAGDRDFRDINVAGEILTNASVGRKNFGISRKHFSQTYGLIISIRSVRYGRNSRRGTEKEIR